MKFCQPHWDKLRAAICERGMEGLIAKSDAEAVARLVADVENPKVRSVAFDPLMTAHFGILDNAMRVAGSAVMESNANGSPRCPICFLQTEHDKACKDPACEQSYDKWIDCAADEALEQAKNFGLVGVS
jgi:hypothetical protein